MTTSDTSPRCENVVHWFDIDMATRCIRSSGHLGLHRDRLRSWDNNGLQHPQDRAEGRAPVLPSSECHQGMRSLTVAEVVDIRARHDAGEPVSNIARCLGQHYQVVYACAKRRTYRDVKSQSHGDDR